MDKFGRAGEADCDDLAPHACGLALRGDDVGLDCEQAVGQGFAEVLEGLEVLCVHGQLEDGYIVWGVSGMGPFHDRVARGVEDLLCVWAGKVGGEGDVEGVVDGRVGGGRGGREGGAGRGGLLMGVNGGHVHVWCPGGGPKVWAHPLRPMTHIGKLLHGRGRGRGRSQGGGVSGGYHCAGKERTAKRGERASGRGGVSEEQGNEAGGRRRAGSREVAVAWR